MIGEQLKALRRLLIPQPPRSLLEALAQLLPISQFKEALAGDLSPAEFRARAALVLGCSEAQLMRRVAGVLRLPFLRSCPPLRVRDLPCGLNWQILEELPAVPILSSSGPTAIACCDPQSVRSRLVANGLLPADVPIIISPSAEILSAIRLSRQGDHGHQGPASDPRIEPLIAALRDRAKEFGAIEITVRNAGLGCIYTLITRSGEKLEGDIAQGYEQIALRLLNGVEDCPREAGLSTEYAGDLGRAVLRVATSYGRDKGSEPTRRVGYLIDDDPGFCKVLQRFFELNGVTLRAFGSAGEFLAELPQLQPAAIICDLKLNIECGTAIVRRVREIGLPWKAVPVYVLTADHSLEARLKALRAGATAVLAKEDDPLLVLEYMRYQLSEH